MSGRGRGNSGRGSSGRGVSSRGTSSRGSSSRGSSGGLLGGSSRSRSSGGLLGGSSNRGNSGGLLGGSNNRGNSGGLLGGGSRSNSGMSLGRVAKKAAVATAVNRVVGNTIDNRMGRHTNNRGFNNTLGSQMQQRSSSPIRDIQEIRDRTGASLHDAKRAYERNNNNIDAAIAELTGHHPQQEATNFCPNCNASNPQHAQFCLSCGGGLAAAQSQGQPMGQQPQQPVQTEQQARLSTCPGCKASLAGVTGNICPYCRSAIG